MDKKADNKKSTHDSKQRPFVWRSQQWLVAETTNFKETRLEEVLSSWKEDVEFMFQTCSLCTLSTTGGVIDEKVDTDFRKGLDHVHYPETSLMFYCWHPDENILIFTTPTEKDLKYQNIKANDKVSLLLHNFAGNASSQAMFHSRPGMSITCYGIASICQKKEESKYRKVLSKHAGYAHAYQGRGTKLIKIELKALLLVNIRGEVLRLRNASKPITTKPHRSQKRKLLDLAVDDAAAERNDLYSADTVEKGRIVNEKTGRRKGSLHPIIHIIPNDVVCDQSGDEKKNCEKMRPYDPSTFLSAYKKSHINDRAKNKFLPHERMGPRLGRSAGCLDDPPPNVKTLTTPDLRKFFVKNEMDTQHLSCFYRGEFIDNRWLWYRVAEFGGYDQVNKMALWRMVGISLGAPPSCSDIANVFKKHYERALLEFERAFPVPHVEVSKVKKAIQHLSLNL